MKPTPEQIAAAKDELRNQCEPKDHHLVGDLIHFVRDQNKASNILLAALEAAEAKVEAMASRESASVSKEIETSADMLAQVQNAEARVKELEQQLRGTMQAGGYDYFSQQLQECERYWGIARNYAEQMKKKLEAAEADSARLDWLEKAPASTYPSIDPDPAIGLMHFVAVVEDNPHERRGHLGKTLREAIDAARKEDRT